MRKIKKLVAVLLAATMMLAMGVTAFAADGTSYTKTVSAKYEANVTLYKDAACSSTSMGNKGIDNPAKVVVYTDGTADLTLYTHQFTYIGIKGALTGMTLDGIAGKEVKEGSYDYIVSGLDASKISVGNAIEGTFTVSVLGSHSAKTGYLKINSLTAAE